MPKMIRRVSNISTLRGTLPTSPGLARNFMNFRFNHLTQRNTLPNVLGRGSDSGADWGPCNSYGKPCVYGNTGEALGEGSVGGGMTGPRNDPGEVKV